MDFEDSPEEAAFRLEGRAWLEANARRRTPGSAEVWRTLRPKDEDEDASSMALAKRWQILKADAGFAGIQWPSTYGGRGLSSHLAGVFKQEEANFDVPGNSFQVAVDMVGPTLIAHGTEEQKLRHLEPIKRGDEVWCQLFSEPDAGSDLAGLSTRAELDGDEFVVNGQKVWTSGAQSSDWAILLVRTNPDERKHRGITYLLLDMTTPGIDVRPLRQIDGAVHFNEVFLTDVRVPLKNVVGHIDGGWGVTMTTLVNERSAIGGGGMIQISEILNLARQMGRTDDAVFRQRLAKMYTYFQITRYLGFRVQTSVSQGLQPGPESSVMKLHISRQYGEGGDLYMALLGAAAMLSADDAPFDGFFQGLFLSQWAPRIGGGTDQIQRNIAGERVLGLPAEPRVDKDKPFRLL